MFDFILLSERQTPTCIPFSVEILDTMYRESLPVALGILLISASLNSEPHMSDSSYVSIKKSEHTNRLIHSASPYLIAHADNPVDWYPWGEEALEKARVEDKPIFLSIGYATCHWCHVMEDESFEDEATAAILNEYFVSIKVDREERPDIDHIYGGFTVQLTGRSGWPTSLFLTPEMKPFYAGTYFPSTPRYGRPAFKQVLTELATRYREHKKQVIQFSQQAFESRLGIVNESIGQVTLNEQMFLNGASGLLRNIDRVNGGFNGRRKYPKPVQLSMLLRGFYKTGDSSYLKAVVHSVEAMARGAIHDHLGGGFHRYTIDPGWSQPHFEKMLYDNALLTCLLVDVYRITHDEKFRKLASHTLDFISREMTDSEGGFYSALDADSEGKEGWFYVWSNREIEDALGPDAPLFNQFYNVSARGRFDGKNALQITGESDRIMSQYNGDDFDEKMASARAKLFEARRKKIRPLTDDKILTSWNGLALSAFCRGFQITGENQYLQRAINNATFVEKKLFNDGRLTHSYRNGVHSSRQFVEDYAYYIRGLLDLYESDLSESHSRWLDFATSLAETALVLFMDTTGTIYLTEVEGYDLILRPKTEGDGVWPSPNSLLIESLFRLHRLTGAAKFYDAAECALMAVSGEMARNPTGMSTALEALDYFLSDKIEIVIVGVSSDMERMAQEVYDRFIPHKILAVSPKANELNPLFIGRQPKNNETVAYLCRNSVCLLPVSSAEDLRKQLDEL